MLSGQNPPSRSSFGCVNRRQGDGRSCYWTARRWRRKDGKCVTTNAQCPYSKDITPGGGDKVSGGDTPGVHEAALRLWDTLGWCVVPAYHPVRERDGSVGCSCRSPTCDKPGKHPIGKWGGYALDAKTRALWRQADNWANGSLLTGVRSGVVVADTDPRHGGTLDALWELGWSRDTVIARTGGGGWHVYAVCPAGGLASMDGYATGIEFKADGKQVLVPPSLHPSRHHYRWLAGHAPWERAVAPLPDGVLVTLKARPRVAGGLRAGEPQPDRDDPAALVYPVEETRRIATALYRKGLRKVAAGEGRNNTAYWLARQLDSLGMTRAEVVAWVVAWGREVDNA